MRLALVGPSWPHRGGIARATTALAAALAARGELAAFVVPFRQYPAWLYPGHVDIDREACFRQDEADPVFAVLEPWTWPAAVRRLRGARADALALPVWTQAWAPFQRYVLRRVGLPTVGVVHNPHDHDAGRVSRAFADAVLGRCGAYLCHASSVAAGLRDRFPGRPVGVHPLPPPPTPVVDRSEARRRLGVPPGVPAFLCFGLIRPYKGVDVLLEAFARIDPSVPAVLLVAGEPWGETRAAVARRVALPDLAGRVVARLEWVPEGEAADWFAAADAVVLPYRAATGSAVAAQAVGAGLPIVATAVGGLPDVVRDGENGVLVAPDDVEALAAGLRRLLSPDERRRLADGAFRVAGRWNWDSYAGTLGGLVNEMRSGGAST